MWLEQKSGTDVVTAFLVCRPTAIWNIFVLYVIQKRKNAVNGDIMYASVL